MVHLIFKRVSFCPFSFHLLKNIRNSIVNKQVAIYKFTVDLRLIYVVDDLIYTVLDRVRFNKCNTGLMKSKF